MAFPSNQADLLVPIGRVLPFLGRNMGVAARRLMLGRLRFRLSTGLRVYVSREDYLSLCEATWDIHVRRMTGRGTARHTRSLQPPVETPPVFTEERSVKPIHDGHPLDCHGKNPVFRLAFYINRWLSG